jgi:hypothetical protein
MLALLGSLGRGLSGDVRMAASRLLPVPLMLAAVCVGCSSGGSEPVSDDAAVEVAAGAAESEPVRGEVMVSWRNLDPRYPATAVALVNDSSSTGQRLRSGTVTSSTIRVLTDAEMGWVLAEIERMGFHQHARDGLDVAAASEVPGRKGIVTIERDGTTKGLLLTTGLGTSPLPKVYVQVKDFVNKVHGHVVGGEVRASVGPADESIFSAPPARLKRP